MDIVSKCKKSPGQGGMSRDEVNKVSREYGLNPKEYRKKDELCDALIKIILKKQMKPLRKAPTPKAPPRAPSPKLKPPSVRSPSPKLKAPSVRAPSPKLKAPPRKIPVPKVVPVPTVKVPTPKVVPVPTVKVSKVVPTPKLVLPELPPEELPIAFPRFTNEEIATKLNELANFYSRRGEEFRAKTFKRSASLIKKHPVQITDPKVQLASIPGIGPSTIDVVQELLTTGQIASRMPPEEEIPITEREKERILRELESVFGIGTKKAADLYRQGVTGIEDLVRKSNEGLVSLNNAQKLGVAYYDHFKQRIPRDEVKKVGEYIIALAKRLDPQTRGEIVGSYRRGRPDSGDIDILLTSDADKNVLSDVVKFLRDEGFIKHIVSFGDVKFAGTYLNSYPDEDGILRHIDIRYVPLDETESTWASALLHSTGSDNFNVRMREEALKKGMTLSEFRLFRKADNSRIPSNTEADIYEAIGIQYVLPEHINL